MFSFGYLGMIPALTPHTARALDLGHHQAMLVTSVLTGLCLVPSSHPFDTIKSNLQGDLGRE